MINHTVIEMENILSEVVVACFKVLSCHSPRMSDYSTPLRIVRRMISWTERPVRDVVVTHVMAVVVLCDKWANLGLERGYETGGLDN